MFRRVVRWLAATLAWIVALGCAFIAGFLLYMEGRFAVWCGDDICEGGIPAAIVTSLIAAVAFTFGLWIVRPRPRHRPPRSRVAAGLFGVIVVGALVAVPAGASGPGPHLAFSPTSAAARPDFDGDGYADLAIGVPGEKLGRRFDVGTVNVLYGSPDGLTAEGNRRWIQAADGVQEASEAGDNFGRGLAAGDFDGDGFTDLAIGAAGETLGKAERAGALFVLFGSAQGLTADNDQFWTQSSPGVRDRVEPGDAFGDVLVAADFDADGYEDLAIGVASEDLKKKTNAGAVQILFGSPGGLTAEGNLRFTQKTEGVPDRPERYDEFGIALAAGHFDDDAYADLAIGAPFEGLGVRGQGAVTILRGSATGLTSAGAKRWSQDSAGIEEEGEAADHFGLILWAGDFDGDGRSDLAVGTPHESVGELPGGGAVNVIYGSATGLETTGNQLWTQDSEGIEDETECVPAEDNWCDLFGWALGAGDVTGDGIDDLFVGAPGEDLAVIDQGAVHVIHGSASGLTATGNQVWSQDSEGVEETGDRSDRLGWALFAGDFGGHPAEDVAIGVPWEGVGGEGVAGVVNVLYGSASGLTATGNQLWSQGSEGVLDKPESGDMFGQRLPGAGYPA